ncbi:hypothetical protein [Salinactinospora qingdaonensis]|uniref:Uncharacterized protein n=1 Tax=Salinactinospora qingdaonensis TaxID=702744 RepID=A0ABP7F5K1_9ACTN
MNARPVSTDLVLAIRDVLDRYGYRSADVRSLGAAAAVVARLVEVYEGQAHPGTPPPVVVSGDRLAAPGAVRVSTGGYVDEAPHEVRLRLGPACLVLAGTSGTEAATRIAAAGAVAGDILTASQPAGGAPAPRNGGHR